MPFLKFYSILICKYSFLLDIIRLMKKFKHPLKDTNQFIEVPLVYILSTSEETHHEYLVTEEDLKEINLSASKFKDYLQHKLNKDDPSYELAADLWATNKPYTKREFSITRPTSRDQIIEIISINGSEYIEPIQQESNFLNINNKES